MFSYYSEANVEFQANCVNRELIERGDYNQKAVQVTEKTQELGGPWCDCFRWINGSTEFPPVGKVRAKNKGLPLVKNIISFNMENYS